MKKVSAFFLAVLVMLVLEAAALADVIWEPNNKFYEAHRDQCEHQERSYYANGPDGFVTLWDAPNGSTAAAQYENGTALRVYWTYRDWGCVSVWRDGAEVSGWTPMKHLYLIYDYLSFQEEYGESFQPYDGQFADYDGPVEGIELYEYPGYGWPKLCLTDSQQDFLDAMRGTADTRSCFTQTYQDPNGDLWGFAGYLYGERNFWVCLNNPTGEGRMNCMPEEYVVENLIETGEVVPPQTPVLPTVSYLPYFLAAGTVGVTAVLLVLMKRRKPKN